MLTKHSPILMQTELTFTWATAPIPKLLKVNLEANSKIIRIAKSFILIDNVDSDYQKSKCLCFPISNVLTFC